MSLGGVRGGTGQLSQQAKQRGCYPIVNGRTESTGPNPGHLAPNMLLYGPKVQSDPDQKAGEQCRFTT